LGNLAESRSNVIGYGRIVKCCVCLGQVLGNHALNCFLSANVAKHELNLGHAGG
jgi:hypothetical protein